MREIVRVARVPERAFPLDAHLQCPPATWRRSLTSRSSVRPTRSRSRCSPLASCRLRAPLAGPPSSRRFALAQSALAPVDQSSTSPLSPTETVAFRSVMQRLGSSSTSSRTPRSPPHSSRKSAETVEISGLKSRAAARSWLTCRNAISSASTDGRLKMRSTRRC